MILYSSMQFVELFVHENYQSSAPSRLLEAISIIMKRLSLKDKVNKQQRLSMILFLDFVRWKLHNF